MRDRVSAVLVAIVIVIGGAACPRQTSHRPACRRGTGAILWQQPADLTERDLYYGPWGARRAPIRRRFTRSSSANTPASTWA